MASLTRPIAYLAIPGFVLLALVTACRHAPPPSAAPEVSRDDATLIDGAVATIDASVDVVDAAPDVVDAGARVDARAKVVAPPRPTLTDDDEGAPVGKHGDVCRRGERHLGDPGRVVSCGPGLSCCYPCGIQGCDWVCHTPQECAVDSRRP